VFSMDIARRLDKVFSRYAVLFPGLNWAEFRFIAAPAHRLYCSYTDNMLAYTQDHGNFPRSFQVSFVAMEPSHTLLVARCIKDSAEVLSCPLESVFNVRVARAKPLRERLDLWKCEFITFI
jgi:hypothetical protein